MQNCSGNYATTFNIRSNFVRFIQCRSSLITFFSLALLEHDAVISILELFKLVFETIARHGNNYAADANFCCLS